MFGYFRPQPWTGRSPRPECVWLVFQRVLREMHSTFSFVLPSVEQQSEQYREPLIEDQQ